ncbi:hypothetical protein [Niallia alba]|uniref:Uncharacterized protein n=1 Tax=Niallia alba TaxID=2729105 RepID=A0A7Y0KCW2_9BACI|nr:hypothetical protein [Niallia alba]NMO80142.1 hypothetical protein [Niallia alba]
MLKLIKKASGVLLLGTLLFIPVSALASTTVYNSTYAMSGGVNSKEFSVNQPGTFQVETWGNSKAFLKGYNFTVFLKKNVSGPDEVISSKDDHKAIGYESTTFNITKSRGSGKYYAYLRNYTGHEMTGDITITIKD